MRSIQKQSQFFTEKGKWRIAHWKNVDYVIRDFVDPEIVATLYPYVPGVVAHLMNDMQSVPEGGVPRSVGRPILQELLSFRQEVDEFYMSNASLLDHLHNNVADEEKTMKYTLEELACKGLGIGEEDLDDVVLFAVHRTVRRNAFFIDNERGSPSSTHYLVQSKKVADIVNTVSEWVYDHTEFNLARLTGKQITGYERHPMQRFLETARRLIRRSRMSRAPTTMAAVGPTAQQFEPGQDGNPLVYREVETEEFHENDQKIIKFLMFYCIPPWHMSSAPLKSAGSHIMRATRMYGSLPTNAATMPLFLQELGVIAPWENLRVLDEFLALNGHGISEESDAIWDNSVQEAEKLTSTNLKDSMHDMRIDWGNLPIYCVDAPSAHEIDDGVSLERISGSDDTFWIRIHIANPSAFIPPDNPIMQAAASRYQTLYIPERTYPMLPGVLAQEHFSLAPGRPTLTFSAKMNLKGEVLDTNIINGIARNVVYITHDRLRKIFIPDDENDVKILRVGGGDGDGDTIDIDNGDSCDRELQENLTSEDEETFQILRQMMLKFREWRLKNGAMEWPNYPETSVKVNMGEKTTTTNPYNVNKIQKSHHYTGDPIITLKQNPINPHEVPDISKTNLISLLMNLASYISGKWCDERNIPAIYDGTWYHPEYEKLNNQNISNYGGSGYIYYSPPFTTSSSNKRFHVSLGLDSYIKSTSPLRRFSDLLVHYQIEAVLRFESLNKGKYWYYDEDENGEEGRENDQNWEFIDQDENSSTSTTTNSNPKPKNENNILPFKKPTINKYIKQTWTKKSQMDRISTISKQFWSCQLLFRSFYFPEEDNILPETFKCLLHRRYSDTLFSGTEFDLGNCFSGVIVDLGVKCQVLIPEGFRVDNGVGVGDGGKDGDGDGDGDGQDLDVLSVVMGRILSVDMSRLVVVLEATEFVDHFKRVGEWA